MKRRLLEKRIKSLDIPLAWRCVLRMYHDEYEPMSYREIGEMFDKDRATIMRWIHNAYNRMAPEVQKAFKEDPDRKYVS